MNTNEMGADIKGQKEKMLNYMRGHKKMTRAVAWDLGIANGPEIIRQLINMGHVIDKEDVYTVNEYGQRVRHREYTLIREAEHG